MKALRHFLFGWPGLSLAAVLLLSAGASWYGLRPLYLRLLEQEARKPDLEFEAYWRQGVQFTRIGRPGTAVPYLRMALEKARTPEQRMDAGLAMGQALLAQARSQPVPNALVARQYFSAVIDGDARPEARMQAYRGIIDAAALMKDIPLMNRYCLAARQAATNTDDQAALLQHQLDVYFQIGTLADIERLMPEIRPLLRQPELKKMFTPWLARVDEEILLRDDWFAEYAAEHSGQDPADLRRELTDRTIAEFKRQLDKGPAENRTDALFRIARLSARAGDYAAAEQYIQRFLDNEPSKHLDETLLILAQIARVEGETRAAEELISTFLKRYRLGAQAAEEFTAVLRQLEEKGSYEAAYDLLKQFIVLPAAQDRLPEFLSETARLANRIGRYDEGAVYFNRLLQSRADSQILCDALLRQAEACRARNDLAEAAKWLVYYLVNFPSDPRRGAALYDLFDIKVRAKSFATDIMLVGAAAVRTDPTNPKAVDTLLIMAGILEKMGLYRLAQVQYNKIGLLNVTAAGAAHDTPLTRQLAAAMLGNARCLLRMGELVRADHLLRELVNNFDVEPVRSEAAYWWATMALDKGQTAEAARRLGMANPDRAAPEIAAKVQFETSLLGIAAGASVEEAFDLLLRRLAGLPPAQHREFVRRAFGVYFAKLAEQRNVPAMQKLVQTAVAGPYAADLPLRAMYLRLAAVILEDQGPQALLQSIEKNKELIAAAGGNLTAGQKDELLGLVRRIEDTKAAVDRFSRGNPRPGRRG